MKGNDIGTGIFLEDTCNKLTIKKDFLQGLHRYGFIVEEKIINEGGSPEVASIKIIYTTPEGYSKSYYFLEDPESGNIYIDTIFHDVDEITQSDVHNLITRISSAELNKDEGAIRADIGIAIKTAINRPIIEDIKKTLKILGFEGSIDSAAANTLAMTAEVERLYGTPTYNGESIVLRVEIKTLETIKIILLLDIENTGPMTGMGLTLNDVKTEKLAEVIVDYLTKRKIHLRKWTDRHYYWANILMSPEFN